jgi:hypothetical protein
VVEIGLKARESEVEEMVNGVRLAISLVSIGTGLIAFMAIGNLWIAASVVVGIFVLSAIIERAVWNRFTDAETKRRDLEDRVRNPPL